MLLLRRSLIFVSLFIPFLALGQEPAIPSQQQSTLKPEREKTKAREQWFQRGRTLPGQSAAALRFHAYQQKLQMRKARLSFSTQTTSTSADVVSQYGNLWPSPLASDASGFGQQDYGWVSGRATSIVIDRADPSGNTVYVGGAFGGVWKSRNAAKLDPANVVWTPLIDDQATLAVGTIAIQQQTNSPDPSRSVVLVGTGEANNSTDSYYGLGILRSTNGGTTWNLISQDASGTHSFAGIAFSKIVFSTANTSLAVAATAGASQGLINGLSNPPSANLGIYYSSNGGVSWNFAAITDGSTAIPSSSVTSVAYNDAAGLFIAAVRFHGFYSSSDGSHWTRLPINRALFKCGAVPANHFTSCLIYRGELSSRFRA